MTDILTLTGVVATAPRHLRTPTGLAITSFRLASSQRRYDRQKSAWVDADTNWYTVTTFRGLADNVAASVDKGDRVVVTGRLRIRPWENAGKTGTAVEVDADAVGHDLFWGTSRFVKTTSSKQSSETAEGSELPPEPDDEAARATEEGSGEAPPSLVEAAAAVAPVPTAPAFEGADEWHRVDDESPF
ncbi:single-stranded DNA-binding protein [Frondihabitans cladoniiphilus]